MIFPKTRKLVPGFLNKICGKSGWLADILSSELAARGLVRSKRAQWCPGWESNPHEEKSPEDFKSSASAIPPPGRLALQI